MADTKGQDVGLDFEVQHLNAKDEIVAEEMYIGLHSLAALYYRLARDIQMRTDLADVTGAHIQQVTE